MLYPTNIIDQNLVLFGKYCVSAIFDKLGAIFISLKTCTYKFYTTFQDIPPQQSHTTISEHTHCRHNKHRMYKQKRLCIWPRTHVGPLPVTKAWFSFLTHGQGVQKVQEGLPGVKVVSFLFLNSGYLSVGKKNHTSLTGTD